MTKRLIFGSFVALLFLPSAPAATNALVAGQTTNGLVPIGQTNFYSFVGTTNETVTIAMVRTGAGGTYPAMDLIAPNGTQSGSWSSSGLEWLAGVWTHPLPQNGSYVIQCRDNAGDESYAYALTLVKHPGPNPGGGAIMAGQTVTNRIEPGDIDVYTFTATTNETVTLLMQRTSDEGRNPYIDLVGPDGLFRTAFSATDTGLEYLAGAWTYQVPAGGTYQVLCRDDSLDQAYDYTLTLLKHPGPNPGADKGSIVAGQTRTSRLDGPGDFDIYTFTATTNETVTLLMQRTSDEGRNPYIDLVGPDGLFRTAFSATDTELEYLAGKWTYQVPAGGTYQVLCRDDSLDQAYDYTLTLLKHPGPNPGADKGTIVAGQTRTNRLDGPGDFDIYTFTATTNETVTLLMQRTSDEGRYPYIDLVGPDGLFRTAFSVTDTELEYLAGKWTYRVPADGTYQVLCRDDLLDQAYDYTLTLLKHPGPNPGADEGTIVAGQTRTNRLDGPGDFDIYTFTATTNETVTLLMQRTSDEGRSPYIDLVGPDGLFRTAFSSTDTELEYLAGKWTYRMPADGTYQVLCRDDLLDQAYDYTLTLLKHPGPNPAADKGLIAPGGTIVGQIASEHIDVHEFDVIAGDSILLSIKAVSQGGGFLAYMDLVAPDGMLITRGTSIGLDCVDQTGRFQILCRDSDLSGGGGTYELRLHQTPGPPPEGSLPEYLQTFACSNQVVVRWSTNATGFVLQQTARLVTPASLIEWSNVTPPYASFVGFNYVTNRSTNAAGFFRLIR